MSVPIETILPSLLFWLFFNIVLSLFPLILNFIVIGFINPTANTGTVFWIEILKEGELFFFSSTISASSIGDIFLNQTFPQELLSSVTVALLILSLLSILLLSSVFFGITTWVKLNPNQNANAGQNSPNESFFAYGSILCAFVATILGSSIFVLNNLN